MSEYDEERQHAQLESEMRQGYQVGLPCPWAKCPGEIVYNGNYFCSLWSYPYTSGPGNCNWALSHNDSTGEPIGQRDRYVWKVIQASAWFRFPEKRR